MIQIDPLPPARLSSRDLSDRSRLGSLGGRRMKCPGCKHENPPESNFCLGCGARLIADTVRGLMLNVATVHRDHTALGLADPSLKKR